MQATEKVITRENPPLTINLRHLRVMAAVAEAGSIAAAAETLCRGASAVTRSIGELETSLGCVLFERTGRGMVPNVQGRGVLARVRRIEQAFATAADQLVRSGAVQASSDAASTFASLLNGRRLAVVAALAEQASMAAVAREFGLTQPAISSGLKELEAGLGAPLFERTSRGLLPTPAGDIVAFYFRHVLAELRHLVSELAARDGELQGTVRVGALPLGRTQVLPQAIVVLLRRHPGLRVVTDESPYEALAASLRRGDIDFIFGALRDPDALEGIVQQPVFETHLSLIVRSGHPLASAPAIDFDALHRACWVLSRPGAPSRDLLDRLFVQAGEPPLHPAVETGDLGILRGLLLAGDMVTAISAQQLRYEIEAGSLVALDFPFAQAPRPIGFSLREGGLASPGARALMEAIRQASRR